MPKSKKENIEEITLDPIEEMVKEPAPVEEPVEEPIEPETVEEGEDITEPDEFIEPEEGAQGEDVEFDEEEGEEEAEGEDAPEEDAPPFLGLMLGAKNEPVSEDPDPQSRIEALLWHIINGTTPDAEPQSRNEAILTAIANSGTYTEEAQSRIEALLIAILKHEEVNITPISRNEAILKAIANSGEYDEEPQSRNEELLLKWLEAWGIVIDTASGAIANFTTSVVKTLVDLKAYFKASQEAGTPTPATPLPISGVSAVSVKHSGSDITDYDEYIVNLGGTYYGGYVEQDKDGKRELVVTHEIIDLGEQTWSYSVWGAGYVFNTAIPLIKSQAISSRKGDILCSIYNNITASEMYNSNPNYSMCLNNTIVRVANSDYSDKDVFKTAMNGIMLVYELAEPFTIALPDGEPITAFNGVNNVWNDSGDTSVEYKKKQSD